MSEGMWIAAAFAMWIIWALETRLSALEARIEALEDANRKPSYGEL